MGVHVCHMPEVVYAFATTGGSKPGASSWQKIRSSNSDTLNTERNMIAAWQLYYVRDVFCRLSIIWCGKPAFPGDFFRDGSAPWFPSPHGQPAHLPYRNRQPFCCWSWEHPCFCCWDYNLVLVEVSQFLIKPFFWDMMTKLNQTKAALCWLLCPNNDSTQGLEPQCHRVGWINNGIWHTSISII